MRCTSLLLALSALLLFTTSAQAAPRYQQIATIDRTLIVRNAPNGRRIAVVRANRPITHVQTSLPILARRVDQKKRVWIKVRLPGRVLGQKTVPAIGWIPGRYITIIRTNLHLVVNTHKRQVSLFRAGKLVRRYSVVVGKKSTPTPKGVFFVEESIAMPKHAAGAPFALALSARSHVFQEFAGGPGQIALHGMDNIGGTLGAAQSHGCIRMSRPAIKQLARMIAPGTIVIIV